jgi:hypothetical protein
MLLGLKGIADTHTRENVFCPPLVFGLIVLSSANQCKKFIANRRLIDERGSFETQKNENGICVVLPCFYAQSHPPPMSCFQLVYWLICDGADNLTNLPYPTGKIRNLFAVLHLLALWCT